MILVDTSVWVDHLHRTEATLVEGLEAGDVGCHPWVIEELALGNIADRATLLGLLADLPRFPVLQHDEVLTLVEANEWWGRGLSVVDVHLLGAVRLQPGARLWTRDKRMKAAALQLSLGVVDD